MARVLCIGDFELYAEMIGQLLSRRGGHEVMIEVVPFALSKIAAFDPEVVVVSLVRKPEALRSPLVDFETEIHGAKALKAICDHPTASTYPLVVTAIAVEERELPRGLSHLAFIQIPEELGLLLTVIEKAAQARGQDMAPE